MKVKYPKLLSPLIIGNVTLKDRICFPNASPHFLQGPEKFPADGYRRFYANLARNGAAYIDMAPWDDPDQRRPGGPGDHIRMQSFDMSDPSVQNYLTMLTDDLHLYGSKACLNSEQLLVRYFPMGYMFGQNPFAFMIGTMDPVNPGSPAPEGMDDPPSGGMGGPLPGGPAPEGMDGPPPAGFDPGMMSIEMLPAEKFDEIFTPYLDTLQLYRDCGFDMVSVNISFLLYKHFNTRDDAYGLQTPENAARFSKLLFSRIRERFGPDFLIEAIVYGQWPKAYDIDWLVRVLKELEGSYDVLMIKEQDAAANHPTGFQFTKGYHPNLEYARKIKAAGIRTPIALNGGYQDPAEMEGYLEEGVCEMFSMGRGLFSDPDYYEKISGGRTEDVTPCVWCNKCHGIARAPYMTCCTVNPSFGLDVSAAASLRTDGIPKKVAVIGGGPIGMRAAIMAAQAGHSVTLYEKTGYLGGQLYHTDHVSFKWPLRDYKDWLVKQLYKSGVTVKLNTDATPELIEAEGFDSVLAALGARPNIPSFARGEDGAMKEGLVQILDVFGKEDKLGHKVIIVGGSETGVETGMHLCEKGHEVTVMTRQDEIAKDASHLHSITMASVDYDDFGGEIMHAAWESYPGFRSITNASTLEVTPRTVRYADEDGKEHTLEADTVVICGGMKANREQAAAFSGSATRVFMIGDCEKVANIQAGNRSALGRVSQL